MSSVPPQGRVLLAGTPLGNPRDASARLIDALRSAAMIAAEDTRRMRRLCADLGVVPAGRVISFFDANETSRIRTLIDMVRAGRDVLVLSDAGMPCVSDPGYRLVIAAIAAGLTVTVLPGPSAVTAALAVSGLPVNQFCFEGFLPRRSAERRRALATLSTEPRTIVLFEAPHRLGDTLDDLVNAFGDDRPAVVCRELTKTYEEVRRGTLAELAAWAAEGVRGEITLVVGGRPTRPADVDAAWLADRVAAREAEGVSRKQAISDVAAEAGIAKRAVFDALVARKRS